jgi:hypothetical protein
VTGPGRDWDKELADIDKIIAKTPPAQLAAQAGGGPPAAPPPGGPPARGPSVSAAPVGRKAALSTWLRVLLGVALAAGMTQWPYFHACGPALFLYLGSSGVVVLAGLWGAVTSWRRRMGLAHTMSLLVLLTGLVLAASEVLPRIGYAKRAAVWFCP